MRLRKNQLAGSGVEPYGSCRRHENVENPKSGFPTFSQRLGKLSAAQNAATSFPQLPQGLRLGLFEGRFSKAKTSAVSDPIDVWHGDDQCREFGMK